MIVPFSKNKAKLIQSLKIKKYRNKHMLFVAEGIKIISDLIASEIEIQGILCTENWYSENKSLLNQSTEVYVMSKEDIQVYSALTTTSEVIAICKIPQYKIEASALQEKLIIILEDIQDPGNLGTIIRTADWFGIDTIICSQETVDVYNAKTIQATMGSICRVKVHYTDLKLLFANANKLNIPIYSTVLDGNNLYEEKLTSNGFIVMGNEGKGLSSEIIKQTNRNIHIPAFGSTSNNAESLNVSIATALIVAEFKRQSLL